MKLSYRISKRLFLRIFFGVVLLLWLLRLCFPSLTRSLVTTITNTVMGIASSAPDAFTQHAKRIDSMLIAPAAVPPALRADANPTKHKIYSVPNFSRTFPDMNDVQIETARRLGCEPQPTRKAAASLHDSLVYVGMSPYYHVKSLSHSIPYLTPKAERLLTRIGRNFIDSQYVKHIPPSKILVSSITRTDQDVSRLRRGNVNALANSCHRYGTTFDISYVKYYPIQDPDSAPVRPTRDDTLKYILSEVLRDLRQAGACYVKYEVKQPCYHITVR